MAVWAKKTKTHLCAVYKRLTSQQRHTKTESEGMEKYIQVYKDAKKAEVAITHITQNKF